MIFSNLSLHLTTMYSQQLQISSLCAQLFTPYSFVLHNQNLNKIKFNFKLKKDLCTTIETVRKHVMLKL